MSLSENGSGWIHGILASIGFIPVVGAAADLGNAALYAAEGNFGAMLFSAVCAVPCCGDVAGVLRADRLFDSNQTAGNFVADRGKAETGASGLDGWPDIGEDLSQWWDNIIDFFKRLFGLKSSEEEEQQELQVSREEERQKDLQMQSEIFDLMETDTYSKQTWSSANTERRKKILRSFIGEINQIMGLNVNEINFEKLGRGTRGYYSPKTNSVTINEDYLSRKDSYQIMQTSVHEMRHAYQHAAMDQPQDFTVSQETVDQWRENDKNYKTVDKDGYDAYVGQPIEWDAKNFAKQSSDVEGRTPEYAGSWGE